MQTLRNLFGLLIEWATATVIVATIAFVILFFVSLYSTKLKCMTYGYPEAYVFIDYAYCVRLVNNTHEVIRVSDLK